MSNTVSKSELKSKMLEYCREVERTGEDLVITNHGRPVLKLVRISSVETPEAVFGDVRGRVRLPPDDAMTAPIDPSTWSDSDLADLLG